MWHEHMSGEYFWAMWLGMALFWASLIAVVVWGVRRLTGRPRGSQALDILEERFARGDIDAAEFEERRRRLQSAR